MLRPLYWIKTPWLFRQLFHPDLEWHAAANDHTVYLSFDDGPHPEITPWVLEQLDEYDFKASFFLIGDNIQKYPETFNQLQSSDHSLGSHTMQHLNGWHTNTNTYVQSFHEASNLISSNLFRPPYGRITRSQAKEIIKTHRVIMWDVLSGDFDTRISAHKCAENVKKHVKPGSIVVFHDSEKAWPRLKQALPDVLKHLAEKGLVSKGL